ncbi:acyl carrier protein [Streptacidiphilus fuscans]|uniref:Acyl carrier protein n=1 Tax=Streptacidiphilus fuscans TaxID=2789292 RepID=A0A931AZQ9_9ACTN|nr:acyl carrier protein [Streptacidiphilus fuscans]MBF9068414.1 acyl carrier protein [Streptacidiphilus fuscans]
MSSDAATDAAEALVIEVVAQVLDLDEDEVAVDANFADLPGWDSVNAMRVLVLLERELGEPVDYDSFASAHTVADMVEAVAEVSGVSGG